MRNSVCQLTWIEGVREQGAEEDVRGTKQQKNKIKKLRRVSKFVIISFTRLIKSRAMRGAGLLARMEGSTNLKKKYASWFLSYYKEINDNRKQQFGKSIFHNNCRLLLVFFYFFRYTHKVLVGNSQGKIYIKYLGMEGRMILKCIFKILVRRRGLDLYGSG